MEPIVFEDRGLLFGSHPESSRRDVDGFDMGATKLARKPSNKSLTSKKPKLKAEVVLDLHKKPHRAVEREMSHPQAVR